MLCTLIWMLGCGLEKLLCSGWSMHNWIEKIVHFLEVLKLISWSCLQDVFYNDMRNPKAIDYSEPIIKWTRETKEATERWKAVGGAAGGRKSSGTTNQNSDSVSLPSFRWYSLVFFVCPASFDAVQEGSQTCTDLGIVSTLAQWKMPNMVTMSVWTKNLKWV